MFGLKLKKKKKNKTDKGLILTNKGAQGEVRVGCCPLPRPKGFTYETLLV